MGTVLCLLAFPLRVAACQWHALSADRAGKAGVQHLLHSPNRVIHAASSRAAWALLAPYPA